MSFGRIERTPKLLERAAQFKNHFFGHGREMACRQTKEPIMSTVRNDYAMEASRHG